MYKYIVKNEKNQIVYSCNSAIEMYNFYMSNNCKCIKIITEKNYIITFYSNGLIEYMDKDLF